MALQRMNNCSDFTMIYGIGPVLNGRISGALPLESFDALQGLYMIGPSR